MSAVTSAAAEWAAWRLERERSLADEFGWLTLTSFSWLPAVPAELAGFPGRWSADGTSATLTADPSDGVVIHTAAEGTEQAAGQPVAGTVHAALHNGQSLMWVRAGSVVAELAMRAHRYAVRTRDANAPARRNFRGVPTFEYAPHWVVPAVFVPYPQPLAAKVPSAHPEITIPVTSVGEVHFEYDGGTHRLIAQAGPDGGLVLNFHDRTNGAGTALWRFVHTAVPEPDGTVLVDFNRTLNYPFSFTAFGACPAPLPANQLALTVEAGEQAPASA